MVTLQSRPWFGLDMCTCLIKMTMLILCKYITKDCPNFKLNVIQCKSKDFKAMPRPCRLCSRLIISKIEICLKFIAHNLRYIPKFYKGNYNYVITGSLSSP